jgi:hypothetical protein
MIIYVYERVKARETSCPLDGELSLKADGPQVDNGMNMWKGNGNTTTLFSLKKLEVLNQGK